MKLKNFITPLQRQLSKARSWLRYNPSSESGRRNIVNTSISRGWNKLRNLQIPQQNSSSISHSVNVLEKSADYSFAPLPNHYPQYHKCDRNNPLGCDRPLETLKVAPTAKFCNKCGFLAPLIANQEIRGRRGIYKVESFLSRQGNGRIYDAVQQNNGRSVIIKEYLLPRRCFEEAQTRLQKKDIFTKVTNFQVAQTLPSDFRLIVPSEGIADRDRDRCYLILPSSLAALPNLKTYLAQQGRMETEQVIKLLDQVLQSLEFLHSHKWQFISGTIQQGLVHGNLNLDTLSINKTEVEFLVYLRDLFIWEQLFQPNNVSVANKRVADDLIALGNIGLYLLATPKIAAQNGYPLNPQDISGWGVAPPLQGFLQRLLGLNSPFEDAASARRELRQLISNLAELEAIPQNDSEPLSTAKPTFNWLFWAVFSAIMLLLGGGIWWWKRNLNSEQPLAFSGECCIENIRNVPSGKLTYGIVASSKLQSIFEIEDTYKNAYGLTSDVNNFTDVIRKKQNIQLKQNVFSDRQKLIKEISPRQINFALVNSTNRDEGNKINRSDGEQLISNTIAYDGLSVFVPFVDCNGQCQQLGKYLEQKITIEQLRNIYTAKVSNWQEIYPNIPDNIPIRAFAPKDSFTLKLFEQLLFTKNEDVEAFRTAMVSGRIKQRASYPMLQEIRNLWQQDKIGGIGFDLQSLIYKQCNVYPLAVVKDNSDFFPMLIKQDKTEVNLFKDLSCKDKQDYQLNQSVFRDRQYPLTFSLNLLYLNDDRYQNLESGQKITEILQTREFQCHLSHKNLIPLKLSEKDCKR